MNGTPPARGSRVWRVARGELADSVRSRRVLILGLLYVAGSAAATLLFVSFLQRIERQLAESLGLAAANSTGSVTATLWKSAPIRRMLTSLAGDEALARSLLAVPPLGLFYGWLSCAFAPLLVILTASTRISEEVWSGSVRYALFRVSRLEWVAGKTLGQAAQLALALLLSAVAAWLTGALRMEAYDGAATAVAMLRFALLAWVYALAFLGLATAVSQLCAVPNLALAFGFLALIALRVLGALATRYADDGWRRLWEVALMLTPGGHRAALWRADAVHLLPALLFLLTLGAAYTLAGYARFARRDL